MARFEFRMEPLLKLRKMKQEQAERELAVRLTQFMQHRRQVEKIEHQVVEFYQQFRTQHTMGEIRIGGLIADRRYLNHLHQLRHHQLAALARNQQLVDQARKQIAEAKKQTDMMIKLKERMLERFNKEQRKRETIELDDLANAKSAWMMHKTNLVSS
ncbi:MAG: flagellar export protein FliJ [Phycisphaerae bacterium]